MGYVYKKPELVPGKADAGKQRALAECHEELKASKAPEDLLISWMSLIPIIIRQPVMDGSNAARIAKFGEYRPGGT
jgi:hypothetical protein